MSQSLTSSTPANSQSSEFSMMRALLPGLVLCVVIVVVAKILSPLIGLGSTLLALLVGAFANPLYEQARVKERSTAGVVFAKKKLLSAAIVGLGAAVSIGSLATVGLMLPLVACGSFLAIVVAAVLSGIKSESGSEVVRRKEGLLLGFGNGICGSAAIASISTTLGSSAEQTGRSLAAINLLGTVQLLALPLFFSVVGLSEQQAAVLAGATLQSVGHVGALGGLMTAEGAALALVVKLFRVALLVPFSFGVWAVKDRLFVSQGVGAAGSERADSSEAHDSAPKTSPPAYLLGFAAVALAASWFPAWQISGIEMWSSVASAGKYLLMVAMAGLGLSINVRALLKGSGRSMVVATVSSLVLIAWSLGVALLLA